MSIENKSSKINCLICNSTDQNLLFKNIKDFEYETNKPVDYLICKTCSLISQYPLPQSDLLPNFYPEDYRNYLPINEDLFSTLKKIQFNNLASKITNQIDNRESKILEIGFGNGQLLLALKALGYKNLFGADFTNRVFPALTDKGIKLQVSNVEESFSFSENFDVIIMNNVVEHFLDPIKVLTNCKNNLSKDGKVILITPNSNALEFSVFKNYWAGFHAPRHTFLFNTRNIKMLGDKLGYSKIEVEPMTDPGQISISIQNIFQDLKITNTKLKNGMSWYLTPLSLLCAPIALLENVIGRSTSMSCVLHN